MSVPVAVSPPQAVVPRILVSLHHSPAGAPWTTEAAARPTVGARRGCGEMTCDVCLAGTCEGFGSLRGGQHSPLGHVHEQCDGWEPACKGDTEERPRQRLSAAAPQKNLAFSGRVRGSPLGLSKRVP